MIVGSNQQNFNLGEYHRTLGGENGWDMANQFVCTVLGKKVEEKKKFTKLIMQVDNDVRPVCLYILF